jgi:hypothetical protein
MAGWAHRDDGASFFLCGRDYPAAVAVLRKKQEDGRGSLRALAAQNDVSQNPPSLTDIERAVLRQADALLMRRIMSNGFGMIKELRLASRS